MRTKAISLGTSAVPELHTGSSQSASRILKSKLISTINKYSPNDAKIKTTSDAYYFAELISIVCTVICPPCIIAAIYCAYKAHKASVAEKAIQANERIEKGGAA